MVSSEKLGLFPHPRHLTRSTEDVEVPMHFNLELEEKYFQSTVLFFKKRIGILEEENRAFPSLRISGRKMPHPEEYGLKISPKGFALWAENKQAIFRGLTSLAQLIEHAKFKGKLECLEIRDHPTLLRRGFMLDVSRCKVPTMESLFDLINLLSELRFNELQLYVEHTFAFREHQTVWKNSSPLTAEEIREIDCYCKERFIELVPNLNSFGHFERWLMHEPYKDLAECPEGFRREDPFMERDHGSTLKPNQESLDFIDSLYSEYLPNFSSKNFNVGMDEPWELGQGWSKEEVQREGKGSVYLKHLEGIRKLVEKHDRQMQFWADVLLEEPENAKLLPPSASPIIWGYEPDHPFDEQAEIIASCGLSFCLAPGTATWRSFGGRWPTARQNLANAFRNAFKYGAEGTLLTSWGDCGNHQPWPSFYPSLVLAAQWAWYGEDGTDEEIDQALNQLVFRSSNSHPGKILMEFGHLDHTIDSQIPNASLAWNLLFGSQPEKHHAFLKENSSWQNLSQGVELLQSLFSSLDQLGNFSQSENFKSEISLGLELSILSLEHGIAMLQGTRPQELHIEDLVTQFESNWLTRARPGGLTESSSLLKQALQALQHSR